MHTFDCRAVRARAFGRARLLAVALLLGLAQAAGAAALSLSVDDASGLPRLSKGGPAMNADYVYWGPGWSWSEHRLELSSGGAFARDWRSSVPALGLSGQGDVRQAGERSLVWRWKLQAASARPGAIGGGMAFKFDLEAFGRELGEPELLPGNRGWAWGRAGRERVELRFDPPLAAVFFDGGKAQIRAFFHKDAIAAGELAHTATVTVSGAARLQTPDSERFGLARSASWPASLLDWKQSPVDLSFLNDGDRPAGKRGFLRPEGDKLVFADGTPARFWGTNLTAYALFHTARAEVPAQARRLARLGFNLVRIHHHDSPWVEPNVFGDAKAQDTQHLDAAALEKIDWWVKCLRDEGVYTWLDLHVQRHFKPADGVDGYAEMARGGASADLKGFNYVNRSVQAAMSRFNQAYLEHVNPYTKLRYLDEPAVAGVLLTNENDVTHHYGNLLLPDKKVPQHSALYMAAAERFATRHGLNKDKTWRSWEQGPAKLFLNDLEQGVHREEIERLRKLGLRAPVVGTSTWGDNPLSSLPALTVGDMIDVHAYGGRGELERDPRLLPGFVHWLAAGQVAGRPMTVSEWNVEAFPAPDREAVPLFVAATAAHQGWDAMMLYAYAQQPLNGPGSVSNWDTYNDPALTVPMAAAALLYRQGHVSEATSVYALRPSRDELFGRSLSPRSSAALRTATERGKLVVVLPATPELPWLAPGAAPAGARALTDLSASLLPAEATRVVSDNGQLMRDWERGLFTVNTPRTQAAAGWLGGERIALADVEIALKSGHASVAVQSLDGEAIERSGRILLSLASTSMPSDGGKLPFRVAPLEGTIAIRARAGLQARVLTWPSGAPRTLPTQRNGDRYLITLDAGTRADWVLLSAP